MFYYFGFGPLISPRSLRALGCAPIASEQALLHDVELRFNVSCPHSPEFGRANLVPRTGASVHGVLHTLRDDDLRVLSRAERDGIDFKRVEKNIVTYRGRRVHAFLFLGRHPSERELRPQDLDMLMSGAREMGLENRYLDELESRYSDVIDFSTSGQKLVDGALQRETEHAHSGPASRAIFEAERLNLAAGHENFGFLSFNTGLMPQTPPLDRSRAVGSL